MKKELIISGMSCGHCVMALKNEFKDNNIAVVEAAVGKAVVEVDETITDEKLKATVAEAGYTVTDIIPEN